MEQITEYEGKKMKKENIALIIAGGVGSRMNNSVPKQFLTVENKPVIIHTLERFQSHPNIDGIVVVLLKGWSSLLYAYSNEHKISKLKGIVDGGETGFDSIKNGILEIAKLYPKNEKVNVLIHDAIRPNVSHDIISDSIVKCDMFGSGVSAIPINEAVLVKKSKDSINSFESYNRDLLMRTQTPQTYPLNRVMEAHKKVIKGEISGFVATCDLLVMLGENIYFSLGSEKNIKLTTQEDLDLFRLMLNNEKGK